MEKTFQEGSARTLVKYESGFRAKGAGVAGPPAAATAAVQPETNTDSTDILHMALEEEPELRAKVYAAIAAKRRKLQILSEREELERERLDLMESEDEEAEPQ